MTPSGILLPDFTHRTHVSLARHLGGNLLTEEIPKELGELVLLEKLSVELGGTLYSKVLMM